MPPSKSIAIAIVSHNTRTHLRACLASATTDDRREIVVVDNASSDGSVDMVRQDFPGAVVHANQDNRGYGAAANQAVAACTSRYVFLLNADTVLTPGAPTALAEYLDAHPRVAVAAPRLVYPDGMLQPSCHGFPSAATVLFEQTALRHVARAARHVPGLGDRHLPSWAHNSSRRVDWVKGAALALRRAAFAQVGGFDESFFMYWEETDLCYRLAAAGWETHFAPVTTVIHAGGASTGQRRTEMSVRFLQGLRHFSVRHHSRWHRLTMALTLCAILHIRVVQDTVRLRLSRDPVRRRTLADDLAVWTRALHGS